MRSSTTSSSSLRVGAGPLAMISASLAAPRLRPWRASVSASWRDVARCSDWARRVARAEGAVVEGGGEVEEGAGGRRDRHAVVAGRVVEVEAGGAVDAQTGVRVRRGAEHPDLGVALLPRHEAPQRRRREVAEHRVGTAGLDGGEEAALQRQLGVADRVDAAVDRVQAAVAHAGQHGLWRQAAREQLIEGEDAPLARGDSRDVHIGTLVGFRAVRARNPTSVAGRGGHPPTVAAGA